MRIDFDHGPAKREQVLLFVFALCSQPYGFGAAFKRRWLAFGSHDFDAGHTFARQGFAFGPTVAAQANEERVAACQLFAQGTGHEGVNRIFPRRVDKAAPVQNAQFAPQTGLVVNVGLFGNGFEINWAQCRAGGGFAVVVRVERGQHGFGDESTELAVEDAFFAGGDAFGLQLSAVFDN